MASTIKIKVNINGSSSDFRVAPGTSAAQLAANRQFREDFSLPENITVLVNDREGGLIYEGSVITVRVNASRKAAPRTRVRVSANGSTEDWHLPEGVTTPSQLAANRQFREDFSLPENITVLVNNAEGAVRIASGDLISVRVNASRKA